MEMNDLSAADCTAHATQPFEATRVFVEKLGLKP